MANEAWRAINARCPHYVRSNARCITCSPTGAEDDEIRRRLPSYDACAEWFKTFCSRRYTLCVIYKLIDKMAEEGGGQVRRRERGETDCHGLRPRNDREGR